WQDAPAFQAYSAAKWDLVRGKAVEYAHIAKKKADESGLTAKTEELIERAKKALSSSEEPAPPAEPAKEPAASSAPTSNPPSAAPVAAKSEVPAGYSEEYKAGLEAYREGLVHFKDSVPHSQNEQRELKA